MKLLPLFFGLSAGLMASLSYAQSPTSTGASSIASGGVLNLRFDNSRIGESGTLANNPGVSYYFGNGTLFLTSSQSLVLSNVNLSAMGLPVGNYSPTSLNTPAASLSLNTPAAATLSIGGYTDPWAQSAALGVVLTSNSQVSVVQPTPIVLLGSSSHNGGLEITGDDSIAASAAPFPESSDRWAMSDPSTVYSSLRPLSEIVPGGSTVVLNSPSAYGNFQFVAAPVPAPSTYLLMIFAVPLIVLVSKGARKSLSDGMRLSTASA